MSQTIELPDPLFREINGYAAQVTTSPIQVIQLAWEEFRQRHPQQATQEPTAEQTVLLAKVRALHGSISLPAEMNDKALITEARMEKYGQR